MCVSLPEATNGRFLASSSRIGPSAVGWSRWRTQPPSTDSSRPHSCHLRVSGMRHQHPVSISVVASSAMKTIDLPAVPAQTGSNYPRPFDVPCSGQSSQRLARLTGLTLFGVNLTVIEPGA
jgi:hypothetical protein